MTAYRTASFFRVATYLRLNGEKRPLGFFYVRNINPIEEDLVDLRIVPTAEGKGFLIHMEDHDCSTLPIELKYIDPITAKGICQFIVDHNQGSVYVQDDERPIWEELFGKINYDISFRSGRLRLRGLNGYNLGV
ncbi:MAG: hypothetical protein QNJ81_02625 [Acidimicrobiia bacterium]|nr:hypothetical protein [Acidimicrobiia bacterium]